MTQLFLLVLILAASTSAPAQAVKSRDILIPSESAVAEAEKLDAKAFKLLPRFTFEAANNSSKDEDNPLGVRGGGSFYSFSTGSHSYNKIPQILLEKSKDVFVSGFYGDNYGLIKEVGSVSFSSISSDDAEVYVLSNYTPPRPIAEIRSEHQRLVGMSRETGFEYRGTHRIAMGKTYVLRTISFNEADLLVAIKILHKLPDGSLELAWRKLREYPIPRPQYFTDDELREKLLSILAKEYFSGISGEVNENEITFRGRIDKNTEGRLRNELHPFKVAGIRFIATEK